MKLATMNPVQSESMWWPSSDTGSGIPRDGTSHPASTIAHARNSTSRRTGENLALDRRSEHGRRFDSAAFPHQDGRQGQEHSRGGPVPPSRPKTPLRLAMLAVTGVMLLAGLAACSDNSKPATAAASGGTASNSAPVTVRLGYFPNVTHAPAIVGVENGLFQQALGQNKLQTATFNAGPEAIDALFADSIDATYVGPNPAVNAFQKSKGAAIRIVAGSTSGGAGLVVKPNITSSSDLKGKKIATPQLGNTQDVALRAYLKSQGLKTDTSGGGDVSVVPQANSDTLTQFATGDIDGAWVPEPFFTRMQQESGGKVLVNENTLWPNGQFVTTQLIVATKFLTAHPDVVLDLIKGEGEAIKFIADSPADAQKVTNNGIAKIAGKPLKDSVVAAAFANLSFTLDPIASSLRKSAQDAKDVGLLDDANVAGIYDLSQLNQYLKGAGQPEVKS